ncbi:hypothetical protein [Paraburkholderia xenovorans]|nr:hypothetical protein [Paraburkholderia xenovorans]
MKKAKAGRAERAAQSAHIVAWCGARTAAASRQWLELALHVHGAQERLEFERGFGSAPGTLNRRECN